MKKILALILAVLVMVTTSVSVFAENPLPESVEIAFMVGDSNLKINGQFVEVETPYVVGEGTTLVPLRVITEAFGAEVLWEEATQKITLIYPDVNIVLQIGNKTAIVNDHEETLLEAPVLSNSSTMVPLRFISETFGAEVGYDDGYITVIKKLDDFGSTVTGITDLSKIGDSYYGWTMDTPKELTMSDRSFNGDITEFSNENEDFISLAIYDAEEMSYEEDYASMKNNFSSYALIKNEKFNDSDNNKCYNLQFKDGDDIIDIRACYTPTRTYEFVSAFDAANGETKTMFLALLDSFKVEKPGSGVYDLSNVNADGTRTFKDEKYKISIDIPADYESYEDTTAENEFMFAKFNEDTNVVHSIHMTIYSKSADVTAEKLANSDRDTRKGWANKDLSTVSSVEKIRLNNTDMYRYIHTIKGSSSSDGTTVDTFFEKGDYVYNIAIDMPTKEYEQGVAKIMSTLKTETLDKDEIGTLLRNYNDDDVMLTADCGTSSFKISSRWIEYQEPSANGAIYENSITDSIITYTSYDVNEKLTTSQVRSYVNNLMTSQTESSANEVERGITTVNHNKNMFYTYDLKYTDSEGDVHYVIYYITYKEQKMHVFFMIESDIYYQGSSDDDFLDVIKSFKIED